MTDAERSGCGSGARGVDPEGIRERTLSRLHEQFERRIMNNVHRGEYVECLVAKLLGPEWALREHGLRAHRHRRSGRVLWRLCGMRRFRIPIT